MAMDPFRMNSKETFQLKPSILFYPSQYSASARWSTRLLLKFPYISICASKPTRPATSNICKNDHATTSRTVVLPSDTTPLSYSVYRKLRSCITFPVLLAETNVDEPSDGDETNPRKDTPLVSEEEIMEYIANETGEDRLREFYNKNPRGGSHPAYDEVALTLQMSALLGLFVGFYLGYRQTSSDFKEQNRGTTFRSHMSYQKMRIDKSIIGGAKLAVKGSIFLGSFVTLMMGISKCVSIYRNKTSFVEYSIAGSVTGALFRFHLGPKGMVAGGVVGLALGSIGGLVQMAVAKAAGETQESKHYRYTEEKLTYVKKSKGVGVTPITASTE